MVQINIIFQQNSDGVPMLKIIVMYLNLIKDVIQLLFNAMYMTNLNNW